MDTESEPSSYRTAEGSLQSSYRTAAEGSSYGTAEESLPSSPGTIEGSPPQLDDDRSFPRQARQADVVIVGAGVSGLSAAYQLMKTDPLLRVIVLEAKDRVGGRTVGQQLHTKSGRDYWDLGGQWIGTCQREVTQLLAELGLETFPQFVTGRKLMQLEKNKISSYTGDIPSLPIIALIDLFFFLFRLDRMSREINVNSPGDCPRAQEWDNITVEQFKREHCWTKVAMETFDTTLRCIYGAEPRHMSLLYFLTYAACSGGIEPLISSRKDFGGQELRVKGGAWQICSSLQKMLQQTAEIRLSAPVTSIQQQHSDDVTVTGDFPSSEVVDSDDMRVVVETSGGEQYKCRRVILALPPNQAGLIEYSPSLPLSKMLVFQRMPVGHLTKIVCTYSTAFWREAGLSGEIVTNGGESVVSTSSRGPLCLAFDATSSTGQPAIVSFIGGEQQLEYASIDAEERRRAVLHSLSDFFGPAALTPLDYVEKNWNDERYNGGCPVCVGTPGMMTGMAAALRDPFKLIHFAGTESATSWPGFINGAIQSGYRAANEVLYNISHQRFVTTDLRKTLYLGRGAQTGTDPETRSVASFGALFTNYTASAAYWSLGIGFAVIGGFVLTYVTLRDRHE